MELQIAGETARAKEISEEIERLAIILSVKQDAYNTASNSIQLLKGNIRELRDQLTKLENGLHSLLEDRDAVLVESLQLNFQSSRKEAEDRLRVSQAALLPLQQELAIQASLSEAAFRARAKAEALCLQDEGVRELERQLLRLTHIK